MAASSDPRQAIIDYLSNSQSPREKKGYLAKAETVSFLKQKAFPDLQVHAVRYTSTTNQQWDEAISVIKREDSLWQCSRSFRGKTEARFLITEEDRSKNEGQPWIKISATEELGYWFLYGNIITNDLNVVSVRMVPNGEQPEEEKVNDNLVLFVTKSSPPIEFEFYDPNHILLGKQLWGFTTL